MKESIKTLLNGLRTACMSELGRLRAGLTQLKADTSASLTALGRRVTTAQYAAENAQSTVADKANKSDPVFTGSFSQNRKSGIPIGTYSHAEGSDTSASGTGSHAEGNSTVADGTYSHAEGSHTTARGSYSHAEGLNTVARGSYSHAEGDDSEARGFCSHAEGWFTAAQRKSQHVQGEYNVLDTEGLETTRGKYAHIVGNGTSYTARSNAHTLDWAGVAWFQGRPQFGGTAQDDGSQTVMANGDTEIVLASSTAGSTKKFKITVDDTGALTATEVE